MVTCGVRNGFSEILTSLISDFRPLAESPRITSAALGRFYVVLTILIPRSEATCF
jgi:hypothetical protein